MRSERSRFSGGPLDGRELDVLLGPTGRPPRYYRVPVPGADGRPETVLVYRLALPARGTRAAVWRYAYDPDGPRSPYERLPWPLRRRERRP